jgi:hypothetical protein
MDQDRGLVKGLGLLDATTLVMGSMIGSGVFIVAADISRQVQSPGLMIMTWVVTAVLTLTAALSYGELAAAMPEAGGQYVYLREAFGPLSGFLYGWTLFLVIQTGTLAAVAVAFAKFAGVFFPWISADNRLFLTVNTQQLVAIALIVFLTLDQHARRPHGRAGSEHFYVHQDRRAARIDRVWRLVAGRNRGSHRAQLRRVLAGRSLGFHFGAGGGSGHGGRVVFLRRLEQRDVCTAPRFAIRRRNRTAGAGSSAFTVVSALVSGLQFCLSGRAAAGSDPVKRRKTAWPRRRRSASWDLPPCTPWRRRS